MQIGERLRSARAGAGLSQTQTAKAIGITARSYKAYEAGSINPSYDNLVALADLLGVTTDYLLGREV